MKFPLGTRNTVEVYVDPFSFNQTNIGTECQYNVLGGFLFSNWQEVFITGSGIAPIPNTGGIFYVEVNVGTPGNLVVGIGADMQDFVGFVAFTGVPNDGFLGRSINGTMETVTIPLPPGKRDLGSGTQPPANETIVRRLLPDLSHGFLVGGASLAGLAPVTSSVYGSSLDPTDGKCKTSPCTAQTPLTRFEVRVVLTPRGTTGVWAWAQGYRQFYAEYPVDYRGRTLALHVFNMRRDVPPNPPLLSGIDMRLKLESTFSRAASRIFTGPEMRIESSLFTLFNTPYTIAPPNPNVACPGIAFTVAGAPPAPGFTPLVRWNLAAMGVALSANISYTIDVNLFVQNLTGISNTLLVSLYDGARVLGVLRLPPTIEGPWGSLVNSLTPLSTNPALNFPIGMHTVTPVVVTPNTPLPLYSSRRIDLRILAAYQAGTTQRPNRNVSMFAW
jgi:hypothetical protein